MASTQAEPPVLCNAPTVKALRLAPRPDQARPAFLGLAALLLLLIIGLALALDNWLLMAGAIVFVLILIVTTHQLLAQMESRMLAAEQHAQSAHDELQEVRSGQNLRSTDLALLGRYGNLLLGCTDLAEALQISQQMLSLLLPESAGTIYPLMDGEGLAEATHLWGDHVGETRPKASAEDCCCMQNGRMHLGRSGAPDHPCAHLIPNQDGVGFSTACIPLLAQGKSLGWIYLSSPGDNGIPKLQAALAASDQLALALGNLKLRQSLRDLSVRDPLTGLFNRRYLTESLGRELSRSKRRNFPLSVLAFDLDHFKDFNDSFGHPAGDSMLVGFARILQAHSRDEDIACRQGGEEFVLIMPEMDMTTALQRAAELMDLLSTTDVMHEGRLLPKVTTSIGLASYPEHGASADSLLTHADQALYEAKSRGRNQVVVAHLS